MRVPRVGEVQDAAVSRSRSGHFAADYAEARGNFLDACGLVGARVGSFRHPTAVGPTGEALYTDVGFIGATDAPRILISTSGTHGVEGLCGSGCQVAFLRRYRARIRPPDHVAVLFVHALNPYGFAHLLRTNEDNVDLNRNFVHRYAPLSNPRYEDLHEMLLPADWRGPAHAAADAALRRVIATDGLRAVQSAVTSGQYTHPDGLFYGGNRPTWSNITWRAILKKFVSGRSHVAFIDLHSGLGSYGKGEVIFRARYAGNGLERARHWYGTVTSSEEGSSVSTVIRGTTHTAVVDAAPFAEITSITLEFGTLSALEVLTTLQGENWLANRGDPDSALAMDIKSQARAAFYPDEDEWRRSVAARASEVIARGIAGLSTG